MSKHTPKTWRVVKDDRFDGGRKAADRWIIESNTRGRMAALEVWELNTSPGWRAANPDKVREHTETLAEVEANATLMAAAPELLEALEAVLYSAESLLEELESHAGFRGEPTSFALARAAIAKAKGA